MTTPPADNQFFVYLPLIESPRLPLEDLQFEGPVTECQGFQWKLIVKYDDHPSGFPVFLSCEPIDPSRPIMQWSHEIEYGFGNTYPEEYKFCKGKTLCYLHMHITLDLAEEFENYKFQGTIMKSLVIPYTDFSQPSPEIFTDTVVIMVEKQKFFVSKTTLEIMVPFFKTFFFATKPGAEGFVLQDVKAAQFQELLEFLFHTSEIYLSNCLDLLEIATHIQHPSIVQKCEQFLIENNVCPRKEVLVIAQRFGLTKLMDSVLQRQKEPKDVIEFIPDKVNNLERETMTKILNKINDIKKKGYYDFE